MAYTKIFARSMRLDQLLGYVGNPEKVAYVEELLSYIEDGDKTSDLQFVSSFNCNVSTALDEMLDTKKKYMKEDGVQAYHVIQSFSPGEVTPDMAHRIGRELVAKLWGDDYEVVIATHVDKAHCHNHICINSVALTDGRKYRSTPATYYYNVRSASDELCRQHGLSVIEPTGRGMEYAEWKAAHSGEKTKRDMVREDIDAAIQRSAVFSEWVRNMRALGYRIDFERKHTRIFRPEGGRAFRLSSLGPKYTEDAIIRRILSVDEPLPVLEGPKAKKRVQYTYVKRLYKPYRKAILFRGMQAQYYRYLYKFGALPIRKIQKLNIDSNSERRFKDISCQLRMLCNNGISNTKQLFEFKSALQEQIRTLERERKSVQNKKKYAKSAPEFERINAEADSMTEKLRALRAEIRMCGKIEQHEAEVSEARERMRTMNRGSKRRERERSGDFER